MSKYKSITLVSGSTDRIQREEQERNRDKELKRLLNESKAKNKAKKFQEKKEVEYLYKTGKISAAEANKRIAKLK